MTPLVAHLCWENLWREAWASLQSHPCQWPSQTWCEASHGNLVDKMLLVYSLEAFRQLIVMFRAVAKAGLWNLADQANFLKESTNTLPTPPPGQSLCTISRGPSLPPVPEPWYQDYSTLGSWPPSAHSDSSSTRCRRNLLHLICEHIAPLLKHVNKAQFPIGRSPN